MTITATAPVQTATIEIPSEVRATVPMKAKIDRLRELRAIEKSAKAEAKDLTAEILAFAGLAKIIKWGKTTLATIVDSTSARSVDYDTLKAAYPAAYEATVKPGKAYKQVR